MESIPLSSDPLLKKLGEILEVSLLHLEENHAEEATETERKLRAWGAEVANQVLIEFAEAYWPDRDPHNHAINAAWDKAMKPWEGNL